MLDEFAHALNQADAVYLAQIYGSVRIPMTFMVSAITLVSGQAVFEQVMKMQGVLSVVIEFVGGLVFIYLMLRRAK